MSGTRDSFDEQAVWGGVVGGREELVGPPSPTKGLTGQTRVEWNFRGSLQEEEQSPGRSGPRYESFSRLKFHTSEVDIVPSGDGGRPGTERS